MLVLEVRGTGSECITPILPSPPAEGEGSDGSHLAKGGAGSDRGKFPPNFQVQAYTLKVLLESVSLGAIRDAADRAIVATARHLRCPLISGFFIKQNKN